MRSPDEACEFLCITRSFVTAPETAGAEIPAYPHHELLVLVSAKTNFCTALAKPSFSLLSVTALACAFTSSLELPIAMEKPLLRNIRTSFGMSPDA